MRIVLWFDRRAGASGGSTIEALRLRPPVDRRASAYTCGVILDTGRCMTITLRNARSQLSK
jgi:hypothetical protein